MTDEPITTPAPDTGDADPAAALRAELEAERAKNTVITGRYRDLVVSSRPDLAPVAHLVAGDDPDAIDAAAAKALEVVSAIRAQVQPAAPATPSTPATGVVTAPATVRQPLDTSTMSPGELIRAGLTQRGR